MAVQNAPNPPVFKEAVLIFLTENSCAALEKHHLQNPHQSQNLIEQFVEKIISIEAEFFITADLKKVPNVYNILKNTLTQKKKSFQEVGFVHELNILFDLLEDKNYENVFFCRSIMPLLDLSLCENLAQIHRQYKADFSYGENVPAGLCLSIYGKSFCEQFRFNELGEQEALPQGFPMVLDLYLEKNINKYHVEIHYEEPDLRMLRLDFSLSSQRSIEKSNRILKKLGDKNKPYRQLEKLFQEDPSILFTLPSYLEMELISDCEFACTFCPRQFTSFAKNQLTVESFQKVVDFLQSSLGDTVVTFGGMGEPLQHPQVVEFCQKILDCDALRMLLIETNGKYIEKLVALKQHRNFDKLKIVVNINSMKRYREIHGSGNFTFDQWQSALKNYLTVVDNEKLSKNVILQMLKIEENEDETEQIYALSDAMGVGFLLQKYNTFIDLMPQKRVSDMTPLERNFCWHLRRDLYITANGDVAFCKQDVVAQKKRGSLQNEDLSSIWQSQQKDFTDNFQNRLAKNPNCQNCDEFFTFNF